MLGPFRGGVAGRGLEEASGRRRLAVPWLLREVDFELGGNHVSEFHGGTEVMTDLGHAGRFVERNI